MKKVIKLKQSDVTQIAMNILEQQDEFNGGKVVNMGDKKPKTINLGVFQSKEDPNILYLCKINNDGSLEMIDKKTKQDFGMEQVRQAAE